jgi:hypothetical protein
MFEPLGCSLSWVGGLLAVLPFIPSACDYHTGRWLKPSGGSPPISSRSKRGSLRRADFGQSGVKISCAWCSEYTLWVRVAASIATLITPRAHTLPHVAASALLDEAMTVVFSLHQAQRLAEESLRLPGISA